MSYIYKKDSQAEHFYRQDESGLVKHVCIFKKSGPRMRMDGPIMTEFETKTNDSIINSLPGMPFKNLLDSDVTEFNEKIREAMHNLGLFEFIK